ncbi:MAG: tetratricopeptide repeat protein [Terriglobales bacterium]
MARMNRSCLYPVKRGVVLCTVVLLVTSLAAARQQVPPADPLALATEHLYSLEYDSALALLGPYVVENPNDLRALNLLAATLLRQEMFRQGLLEVNQYGDEGDVYKPQKMPLPPGFEQQLMSALDRVQTITSERLKADPQDREALYWAGVASGTRSLYLFTLKRSYMGALRESKNAAKLHRELLKLEPQNRDALLVLGVQDYVLGSLPWPIKILVALTGAGGDKKRGIQQLERCAAQGHFARQDARFVLPVLYMREKRSTDALETLQSLAANYPRNYLLLQEIASVQRVQKNWRGALETYESLLARHRAGVAGYRRIPLSRVLYLAGHSAVQIGENERALRYYEQASQLTPDVYASRAQAAAADLLKRMRRG